MMKKDIKTEEDIQLMVNTFYDKVNKNPLLSSIFNDFSKVDWEAHLPKMYRFWNTLILAKEQYKGSPFHAHIPLPIDKTHFNQWIELFNQNIDEHFEGEVAENTKQRALLIAQTFESKLSYLKNNPE